MNYINAEAAAKKWGLSLRRVQDICKLGKVPGAKHLGKSWLIPEDAEKPADGRRKEVKENLHHYRPLIRKTPFLTMTNLYTVPGSAEEVAKTLKDHPEGQALFNAQIAYARGDIDTVYNYAKYFLELHTGFYAVISGGMLLALCAIWKGDINMWRSAQKHICEAPFMHDHQKDIISLSLAATNSYLRVTQGYPEWFLEGCFDHLPTDSYPTARVYYVKRLLVDAQEVAVGKLKLDDVRGLGLIKTIPFIVEPMITQMSADKIIVAEIYLRLFCAIAYQQSGNIQKATLHIDKAIALALPDRLFGPLAEYKRQFGLLLDERLMLVSPEAAKKVKDLHKQHMEGWTKLHNIILNNSVAISLSAREREVARLVAFGLSDAQIAKQLYISEASVKALVRSAKNKTGVEKRRELAAYV